MDQQTYTVFRTTLKRDGTWLIVTREGKTGWSYHDFPEGHRIVIDAGGEAKAYVLARAGVV